jgi:hypothetical protein
MGDGGVRVSGSRDVVSNTVFGTGSTASARDGDELSGDAVSTSRRLLQTVYASEPRGWIGVQRAFLRRSKDGHRTSNPWGWDGRPAL